MSRELPIPTYIDRMNPTTRRIEKFVFMGMTPEGYLIYRSLESPTVIQLRPEEIS